MIKKVTIAIVAITALYTTQSFGDLPGNSKIPILKKIKDSGTYSGYTELDTKRGSGLISKYLISVNDLGINSISTEEPSFGGISKISGQGVNLNLVKYKALLGGGRYIPLYFLTATTEDYTDNNELTAKVIDNNSGVFNLKWADEYMILANKDGLCDYSEDLNGGCFLTFELGAKILETKNAAGEKKYDKHALYGGLGIDWEIPVFKADGITDPNTPAGNIMFGFSVNVLQTDSEELEKSFELNDASSDLDLKDLTGFLELRASIYISDVISLNVKRLRQIQDDSFEDQTIFKLDYKALEI